MRPALPFVAALPAVFLCLAGAPLAGQQCIPARGPFAGTWAGFSVVHDAGNALDGGTLFDKPVGFHSRAPSRWSAGPGRPDFRFDRIFAQCGGTGTMPDVDATSIGEDWVISDAGGQLNLPANRWAALTLSVTAASRGRDGSTIRRETTSADGVGGDLFSYMLPGSALPAPHVDVVERGLQRAEMGLANAGDVDALDHFMGLHHLSQQLRQGLFDRPQWFFSFSNDSLARVPATWWAGTPRSGATIFVSIWNPTTGRFTCPRIWRRFDQLGLAQGEDVDAIAVDRRNRLLLFSTKSPQRDQLLVIDLSADSGSPETYEDQQGTPISRKIDLLEDDDVDAICAIDPSVRARPGEPFNPMWFSLGVPAAKHFGFPGRADGSVFRGRGRNDSERFHSFVAGWTASGPTAGQAVLAVAPQQNPLLLVPVVGLPRTVPEVFCGDPRGAVVPVPAALAFSTVAVEFRWFLVDANLTEIVEATPSVVRL